MWPKFFTDGIVKYMRSKAGPSSKALTSLKDVEKFVSGEDHAIVGKYLLGNYKKSCLILLHKYRFYECLSFTDLIKTTVCGQKF